MTAPLRLRLDGDALVHNWRWLKAAGGAAACGPGCGCSWGACGLREVRRDGGQADDLLEQ
jgi:alanine racemase